MSEDRQDTNALRSEIWDQVVFKADKDPGLRQAVERMSPFVLLSIIDAAAEVIQQR